MDEVNYLTGFEDTYTLDAVLGAGQFADVIHATHNIEQTECAIKIIFKANLESEYDKNALKEEIEVLSMINHPNIIKLFSVYDEIDAYYLVTELVQGGELLERIEYKEYYTEKEARDFCQIIFQAIGYCHEQNIAHRDIKPENILLLSKDDDCSIKVADFGFAKRLKNDEKYLTTQCGTLDYSSPEILSGKQYDTKVDMWSIGVILYILLCGYEPFIGTSKQRAQQIISGKYHFYEEDDGGWDYISNDAKDLVRCLMNIRPNSRINANDALNHIWINSFDDDLTSRSLEGSLPKLKKFNSNRKFRAAVQVVMIANQSFSELS